MQHLGIGQQLEARQTQLPAARLAHPRAFELHPGSLEGQFARRRAPAMAPPFGPAGMARAAHSLRVRTGIGNGCSKAFEEEAFRVVLLMASFP